MTRREVYYMMQRVNRGDYEMGDIDRLTYQRVELALAVDWDHDAEHRRRLARTIRAERRAERIAEAQSGLHKQVTQLREEFIVPGVVAVQKTGLSGR